jgi:hypothetical protein
VPGEEAVILGNAEDDVETGPTPAVEYAVGNRREVPRSLQRRAMIALD